MDELQWTNTFTWGQKIKGTVERRRVRHRLTALTLFGKLPEGTSAYIADQFTRLAAQTTKLEGLKFQFPDLGASDAEWQKAFEQFLDLDDNFVKAWWDALQEVDRPPGPKEFWPPDRLSEQEKKDSDSGE